MTQVKQHGVTGGHAVAEKRTDLSYDADGQWDKITRYDDLAGAQLVMSGDYTYDFAGRLTSLDYAKGATVLENYDWQYDRANRVTRLDKLDNGYEIYSYDATNQLTGANYQYNSDQNFVYDDNGNRLNNGYATAQTNTVMGNNRLVSDAAYDYAYDAEGNLTQRVRRIDGRKWDYTWDQRNRLTAVDERLSSGTLVKRVEYAYDALDRRVFKQVDDNGNGTFDRSEHFVYDGEHIVLRYQNGQLANRYVHNPDVVDQVFADEAVSSLLTPGETRWQLTDNQNSVRHIYDYNEATGATVVIDRILYESFGKFWSPTNLGIVSKL